MNNYEKELKRVEEKIENDELKTVEELRTHLMELKNRGIITFAQANLIKEELSYMFGKTSKNGSNKRVTRTPQSELFDF